MKCNYCESEVKEDYVDLTVRKRKESWLETFDYYFCDTSCCYHFLDKGYDD